MTKLLTKLRKPNLLKRIWRRMRSVFFLEQWILLFAFGDKADGEWVWGDFTRLIPPPDRIWADPFIWIKDGQYYVFYEEQPFDTKRGRICCLSLNHSLIVTSNRVVLERPYHLSYPFIFEYNGEIYMIPETGENMSVELYRCRQFPDRWEFDRTLLRNIYAVDATLFEYHGKWWMFVNIANDRGSTWEDLHLYFADNPLSTNWVPHPINPIKSDVRRARPAGRLFLRDNEIIRPSQDSSVRYGYATNFNRIIKLSETQYEEELLYKFTPDPEEIIAVHTWNKMGQLLSIDAMLTRARFR